MTGMTNRYLTPEDFDFSHVPDAELFHPEHIYWSEKTAENAAWKAEMKRRRDAKAAEEERIIQERAARRNAIKSAIPYSERLAAEICERISCGELLLDICEDEHLPTQRRCNQWLKEHSDFAILYRASINDRLDIFEEQVIKIADDMKSDFKTVIKNGKERRVVDPDVIMRAKLRIEVRFRHLKALRPERWGETSTVITKDGNDLDNMSLSDLEKKIHELEVKDQKPRAA
jgi:hypothetical protein